MGIIKRLISFFSVIPLLVSSLNTYWLCPDNEAGLKWENEVICVRKADEGSFVSYPRTLTLSDGTLICAYDTDSKICCVKSSDSGLTWTEEEILIAECEGLACANAALIELDTGELLCAYRANGTVNGRFYSSIRVSSSLDFGKTWQPHSVVAEENQEDEGFFGLWEPHFGFIDGKLAVFYSNDSQNGAVSSTENQNIEFKLWNAGSWSEKNIAVDASVSNSRDGMPVWTQTSSGEYVMVIESTVLKENEFFPRVHIIEMLSSEDGFSWEKRTPVYITPIFSDAVYAGAPYVVSLPDGRLCVSYQTDNAADFESGTPWICNVITTKKAYRGRASMTSFTKPFAPFGAENATLWNSMTVHDGMLLVFATSSDSDGTSILLRRAEI